MALSETYYILVAHDNSPGPHYYVDADGETALAKTEEEATKLTVDEAVEKLVVLEKTWPSGVWSIERRIYCDHLITPKKRKFYA